MITTSEVAAGDLQVAAVNIALVERNGVVDCHLLGGAAAHKIVAAFDDGVAFVVGKAHRPVLHRTDLHNHT